MLKGSEERYIEVCGWGVGDGGDRLAKEGKMMKK